MQIGFSQNDPIITFGKNLTDQNKFDEAIIYYEKYLVAPINEEQKVYILLGLAEIYKLKLNYKVANNYYGKAKEVINLIDNKELEFFHHVKMAEFYRKRGLFLEADGQLKLAELISKKKNINDSFLAMFYSRKAALFTEHFFQPDSTLFYANKALTLAKKNNDKDLIFYSTLEIAGVFEEKREYKKSIQYLEELIESAKRNNFVQQETDAQINYTRLLIKDNQLKKALDESMNALDFSKKNDLFFGEMLFTDNIRNIYAKLGNMSKAYEYSKKRTKLTEEYYKKEHNKFLFELEEKYKLTEKDNQLKINNLEIENKNKELITTKARFTLISGLFFSAIISTLLIAYFLKKTKQKNKELQLLSKQNEFLVSETNHRVNNNLQLIAVLIENKIRKNKNENEKAEFTRFLTKVEAIAALHRLLYVTNNVNIINLQEYLMDIKNNFEELVLEENINLNVTIEDTKIHSDTALYLGLLITELFINSIKHAFKEHQQKVISFSLIVKENELFFKYEDNGENSKKIELKPALVEQLCLQLEVDYTINSSQGFQINFIKNHSKNA